MQQEPNQGGFYQERANDICRQGMKPCRMSIYDFALKGKHNQYNTMAAGLAAVNHWYPKGKDPGSRAEF